MRAGRGSILPVLQFDPGLNLSIKKTHKRRIDRADAVARAFHDLVALITPYTPEDCKECQPFLVEMLLRFHVMQQWFSSIIPRCKNSWSGLSPRFEPRSSTYLE